jgi:hypothetical protein
MELARLSGILLFSSVEPRTYLVPYPLFLFTEIGWWIDNIGRILFAGDHIHNEISRCGTDTYCCVDGPNCDCKTGTNTQRIADFLPAYSDLVGSSVSLVTAVATSSLFTPPGATRPTFKFDYDFIHGNNDKPDTADRNGGNCPVC